MSEFVRQVQILELVRLEVLWKHSRVEGSVLIPELVLYQLLFRFWLSGIGL